MADTVDLPFTIDRHLRLLLSIDRGHNVCRAAAGAVRPGDAVLDAGTGTSLLSCIAVREGAGLVVAADREYLNLARAVAGRNGLADRITFVDADLSLGSLPGVDPETRFDVIFAFIYANHPMRDDERARMVYGLRERFGKPGCRVIPNGIRYFATGCDRLDWDLSTELADLAYAAQTLRTTYDLDFEPLVQEAVALAGTRRSRPVDPIAQEWRPAGVMASLRFPRSSLRTLTAPTPFAEVDYAAAEFGGFPSEVTLHATAPGRLTGVVWTQELIVDGRPIWTTETYSPLAQPQMVAADEKVVLACDERWRRTNIVHAQPSESTAQPWSRP